MCESGVVFEVGDGVLDDGVAAVVGFDGQYGAGAVGDDRVVAEHDVQCELGTGSGMNTADDQPAVRGVLGGVRVPSVTDGSTLS